MRPRALPGCQQIRHGNPRRRIRHGERLNDYSLLCREAILLLSRNGAIRLAVPARPGPACLRQQYAGRRAARFCYGLQHPDCQCREGASGADR